MRRMAPGPRRIGRVADRVLRASPRMQKPAHAGFLSSCGRSACLRRLFTFSASPVSSVCCAACRSRSILFHAELRFTTRVALSDVGGSFWRRFAPRFTRPTPAPQDLTSAVSGAVFEPVRGARAAQPRTGFRRGLSNLTGMAIGTLCTRRCSLRERRWCVSSAAAGLGEQHRGYRYASGGAERGEKSAPDTAPSKASVASHCYAASG
jgi:hypothetical protein